jgi:hypothetical protein
MRRLSDGTPSVYVSPLLALQMAGLECGCKIGIESMICLACWQCDRCCQCQRFAPPG